MPDKSPDSPVGERRSTPSGAHPDTSTRLFDPAWRPSRPERLPDGTRWPRIRILVLAARGRIGLQDTLDAVAAQDFPEAETIVLDAESEAVPNGEPADFLLILKAGDRLVPGALTALGLEAVLSGADAVAGLRVIVAGDRVLRLDLRSSDAVLLAHAAILRAGGIDFNKPDPIAALWPRLTAAGLRSSRIGRPVLVRSDDGPPARPAALSIVSLTDAGHRGGAGIAQRRLAEALALMGHRVTPLRLNDAVPPAEAEWTDGFPRAEGAMWQGYDLVLAGNLHGATRSTAVLSRIARSAPVAVVLHDLFPLTGRCAHPKDCRVIESGCDARCPTPDEFPQLAPSRIAAAYTEKQAVLAAEGGPLLLANSDWTATRARALAPPQTPIAQIRLAFPTGVFRPGDRTALRRKLGLPADDVLIVFSAVIADAPDKGFSDVVATIRKVARPGIGFVALGRLDDPASLGIADLHAPGPIRHEDSLAEWYGACDICLTASRLETLGQTPIEAGLCGVPTVAYRATGLTSAVIDGVTGLLVEPGGSLADALETVIADAPRRRDLGAFARIALESRFSHAACAISLHDALAGWERLPSIRADEPLCFAPAMLRHFAFAAERSPGATGTVAAPSRPIERLARRAKRALVGRETPLWMRRALYLASRLRRTLPIAS